MASHPSSSPVRDRIGLHPHTRAGLALACAALFWAGNFVAGRALRDDIDPATLNLLRWTLSLALFLPLVGSRLLAHRAVVRREWRLLLALGATGIAAFHSLVYLALASTGAIQALLILSLAPVAIMAGAVLTGASEATRTQWAGSLVSLAGAGILVTRGDLAALADLALNRGDLWMLAAVLLWAVYSLLLRRRPADLPQDVALAASIGYALLLLAPVVAVSMLAGTAVFPAPTPGVLASLAYIAVFASLLAFLLWSHGVHVIGPERAGQFVHLMPVFGAVLAMPLLGETIVAAQVAGALCVFAGIVLVQRTTARGPRRPS